MIKYIFFTDYDFLNKHIFQNIIVNLVFTKRNLKM